MQYFDLARQGQRAMAKRWQGATAARKGLGPWWNVFRAGFETLSKCRISTWQVRQGQRAKGAQDGFRVLVKSAWRRCGNHLNAIFDLAKRCGKGLKLHGGFWGPGGTCFAQVLKPSLKCRISTWQGRGKGRWQSAGNEAKAARKGLGPWWNVLRAGFETL